MSEINLPPFYVGQRVVALRDCKTEVDGKEVCYFKKGNIAIVQGNRYCCEWNIDIGIRVPMNIPSVCYCENCGLRFHDNIIWVFHGVFAPIEENFQSISLEKVIEKETPLVCVN